MIKKIDTHLHCWDLEKVKYSWLTEEAGILYDNFKPDRLSNTIKNCSVSAVILVQADNSLEETRYLFEEAENHEWIEGVVAWLPLEDPDKTNKLLEEEYLTKRWFKGVRHLMHIEANDEWILNDRVLESLLLLCKHEIPFDAIGINLNQLKSIIKVANKIPELKIMIDHLNQPPLFDQKKITEWKSLITEGAMAPNLYAKISGLTTVKHEGFVNLQESMRPIVAFVLEQFGVDSCCCGSDWPISLLQTSYHETWEFYEKIITSIDSSSLTSDRVLERTARSFYRL